MPVDSLDGLIRRGPYDQIGMIELNRVKEWEANKEAQAQFQTEFREFIETKPLYSVFKITLPPGRTQFYLEVARLFCDTCKITQPFRQPKLAQWYHVLDKELRYGEKQALRSFDLLQNCIYPLELYCQEFYKG